VITEGVERSTEIWAPPFLAGDLVRAVRDAIAGGSVLREAAEEGARTCALGARRSLAELIRWMDLA